MINLAAIGAGNEYIANSVIDALATEPAPADCLWVIQWSSPKRLDLQIQSDDQALIETIKKDNVYYKNFNTTTKGQQYWSSSASDLNFVKQHNDLISNTQHETRSRNLQLATAYALEYYGVEWRYMFTYPAKWATNNLIDQQRYIWTSQYQFRQQHSQYRHLDVGEIQPVSSIHLDFLEQYILPHYEHDSARLEKIKQDTLCVDTARVDSKQKTW
jgi:hypothetical protein